MYKNHGWILFADKPMRWSGKMEKEEGKDSSGNIAAQPKRAIILSLMRAFIVTDKL